MKDLGLTTLSNLTILIYLRKTTSYLRSKTGGNRRTDRVEKAKVVEGDIGLDYDQVFNDLRHKLRVHNRDKCTWLKENSPVNSNGDKRINFIYHNGKDNAVIGGLFGHMEYNWLHLEQLYVDEEYRGSDIGTELMEIAETYAREKGATGIVLETWSFQARPFYEKLGYEVFAELKDCPPGTVMYLLRKELA